MAENDDEKYYYNNYNYNKAHNELDSHVALATFARILGMFSIPLCLIFYTGIILGGVAVVLALLSKGTMKTFLPQAKKSACTRNCRRSSRIYHDGYQHTYGTYQSRTAPAT